MSTSRLLILASGSGSTFEFFCKSALEGKLNGQVVGLVSSRADCGAMTIAAQFKVPSISLDVRDFKSRSEWDRAMIQAAQSFAADWILLCGYTQLLGGAFVNAFRGRIVNTHPSLLPKYGGAGMFGLRVHEAVVRNKEKESGVTVHYVTENYDEGEVIAQCIVPVLASDTAESLSERIKNVEKPFYLETINELISQPIQ